jgi:hypothetical protein
MLSIGALAYIFFFALIGAFAGTYIITCFKQVGLISEDKAKIWVLILLVVGLLVGGTHGWHIYIYNHNSSFLY